MRKNNTYYLSVFIETLSDHFDEVQCIIDSIISNRAQPIETLSWPEYYYEPQDIIGRCWGIDEYNDDSDLRLLEKCTKKDKRIEWFRPRPEKEGAGDNLLADLASAITILAFLWHAYFWCKRFIVKQDYNWKIKRLKKILLSKYIKGGHLLSPRPAPPKYTNAKTKTKEYVFIQELDDGKQRKIFMSRDGKKVRMGEPY